MSYFMSQTPSYPVLSGFGVDVPTPQGIVDVGTTGFNKCGSLIGVQQMLADLGFYTLAVDGLYGPGTEKAMLAFAQQHGINVMGGVPDEFCERLIAEWQATKGGPPGAPPPGKAVFEISPATLQKLTPYTPPPPPRRPLPAYEPSAMDKAKTWWAEQGPATKVALGVGALAALGLIGYALFGGKKKPAYAANRRRRRYRRNLTKSQRRARSLKAIRKKVRGKRAAAPRGKIITLKSGKRFGHLIPPKKYWKTGAKRPSQYAWPKGYKYPIHKPKYCRTASRYFGKHKRSYPMSVRRTVASNINKCKKKFDIGGKPVKP